MMDSEIKLSKELKDRLFFKSKNQWDGLSASATEVALDFCAAYKEALDQGKTEREFYRYALAELEANGFSDLSTLTKVQPGSKVYKNIRGKGLVAAIVGVEDPALGYLIVGSHIDSPRLDLKPVPLYEKNELVFLKTHYYGGIKKYQWAATALALHGVVILQDGSCLDISVGEEDSDPVFTITDLLPHLGREQMTRSAKEVLKGEDLNILIGGLPYPDPETEERFKLGVLQLLNQQYGITERDLISAELEIVPAQKARDVGFDRAFVGAYGQDDRVCAFTSLQALFAATPNRRTQVIMLLDKEETGSDGNTGAQSKSYRYALHELHCKIIGREATLSEMHSSLEKTELLSSDVTCAYDPNFPEVTEALNTCYCGRGVGISKYSGSGGKGGTSDANAEFMQKVIKLFDDNSIPWQVGELGKVDQGGGGTIAMFFANDGMQVLDCGVPVLSMHSCFEITSKIDVYSCYRAYKAFLEQA